MKHPFVFSNQFQSHVLCRDLKNRLPEQIFTEYYKFGFVRNPWDWLVSLYYYTISTPNNYMYDRVSEFSGFPEFIEWICNKEDRLVQSDFFYDLDGNCLVNFIGRFEQLEDDFQLVLDHLDIKVQLPHSNKGISQVNYLKYYSLEMIDMVFNAFQKDIKLLGYAKPN